MLSEEGRRKISEAVLKRNRENNPMRSIDSQLKSSLSHKGNSAWNKGLRSDARCGIIAREAARKRRIMVHAMQYFRELFKKQVRRIKRPFSEETRVKMRLRHPTEETRLKMSLANKRRKPMFGRRFSEESKRKISLRVSELHTIGVYDGRGKKIHLYNGIWMRSTWEVRFAKWMDSQMIRWEYESCMFQTSNGRFYFPDFKLIDTGEFVEVKGVFDEKSIDKMNDFVSAGNELYIIDKSNINCPALNKKWVVD